MRQPIVVLASVLAGLSLAIVACSSAGPPAPTVAPTSPPKVAEPAKAPTAAPTAAPASPTQAPQPTTAPAKAASFPEKGKTITFVAPFAAGGSTDIVARLLAAGMERDLGTPVQVLNVSAGSGQAGVTQMVLSRPDGYTMAIVSIPSTLAVYLDPDRQSPWTRKDFTVVAEVASYPQVISVQPDSPFKTLKDVIDAAKAKPEQVTLAVGALMSSNDVVAAMLEEAAGAKFRKVRTDGDSQNITGLMGGHYDAAIDNLPPIIGPSKSNSLRVLGVTLAQPSPYLPGAPTMVSQGYNVIAGSESGLAVPVGTPKEVVDILSASAKRVVESSEFGSKSGGIAVTPDYVTWQEWAPTWDRMEPTIKKVIEQSKRQ